MRSSPRIAKTVIATHKVWAVAIVVAAVAVVVSVGGSAFALGAHTAPTSAPETLASTGPARGHTHHHRQGHGHVPLAVSGIARMVRHATEVQVVVPSKGSFVTMTMDRGVVSATSANTISIAEADHHTVEDSVSSTTRVLPGLVGGISGIHQGDHVVAIAKGGVATLIWVPSARAHVVHGTVNSVSATSLTLTRAKGKPIDLVVGSKTRVLPASLGGISGVHKGEQVAVRDLAGNAVVVHVHGEAPTGSAGTSRGASGTS